MIAFSTKRSYPISVIPLVAMIVLLAGCRTYGPIHRLFAAPLQQECSGPVDSTMPKIAESLRNGHRRIVQKWTTGDSAIPRAHAPSIDEVASLASYRVRGEIDEDLATLVDQTQEFGVTLHANPYEAFSSDSFVVSLHEVLGLALSQNQVIRRDADFVSSHGAVLDSPGQVPTSLDPSIRHSGYLFGQRGIAAALSDFDSQLQFSTVWGRDESIQNSRFLSGGILPGDALIEETAQSTAALNKNLRSGGSARLFHTWDYSGSNREDVLFSSAYRGTLGAEFRQPLLAGAGRHYSDVAGPPGDLQQGVTGLSQGILIARNDSQIARLDLELAAAKLLTDVEVLYWQLCSAMAQRSVLDRLMNQLEEYQLVIAARIAAQADTNEADRLTLEDIQVQAEQLIQQNDADQTEYSLRLSRLLGFPPESEVALIPQDTVVQPPMVIDDVSIQSYAIANRIEIRQQLRRINSTDHQIRAAQSLLLPQLDGIARYQLNGFGDHLLSSTTPGPDESIQSAYDNLFQNDHTGWQLGFQFSQTIGRRFERTRIRNLRLQSQKQRVVLKEQQDDIRREITLLTRRIQAAQKDTELAERRSFIIREKLDVLKTQYDAGENSVSVLQLSQSELDATQADNQRLAAYARYAENTARLKTATGATLREYGIRVADPG